MDGGSCGQAAVALTNVGQTPIFVEAAGQALVGTSLDEAAIAEAARLAKAPSRSRTCAARPSSSATPPGSWPGAPSPARAPRSRLKGRSETMGKTRSR